MLEFNGLRFARNQSEMLDTLFTGPRTADGFYKVNRGKRLSVTLLDHQRAPLALVSPDGVIVTADQTETGTRYLYAMTTETERRLGFGRDAFSASRNVAVQILNLAEMGQL